MRVVGRQENAVSGGSYAAISAARGVAGQAARARTLVMPNLLAGTGVERIAFVRAGDIHDAVDHHRSHLQAPRVRKTEDPRGAQASHVVPIDLSKYGVTISARIAVVSGPVGLRCDLAISVAHPAQQVHSVIAG